MASIKISTETPFDHRSFDSRCSAVDILTVGLTVADILKKIKGPKD